MDRGASRGGQNSSELTCWSRGGAGGSQVPGGGVAEANIVSSGKDP